MPIQVACQCGQRFAAKDELAGKRVKCPQCGNLLTIPAPQPEGAASSHGISDLLDQAGMKAGVTRCPGCGTEMSPDAILCVMCGFDLRRGHRLKTRVGSAMEMEEEDLGDLPVHGVAALDRAERQIARDKIEQERMGTGIPWWMLFIALAGLVTFAVGMVFAPQDQVMQNSGYVLCGLGGLMSFWFYMRIVVTAFQEAPMQGLLSLVVPPYLLYYVASRWDRVGGYLIFTLVGGVLLGAGYLAVNTLVPMFEEMMKKRKKDDYGMLPWHHRPVVMLVCRDSDAESAWRLSLRPRGPSNRW